MKNKIIHNARIIRYVIEEKGIIRIRDLRIYINFSQTELYLAIGWLACEDKIYLIADVDDPDDWRIMLTP